MFMQRWEGITGASELPLVPNEKGHLPSVYVHVTIETTGQHRGKYLHPTPLHVA